MNSRRLREALSLLREAREHVDRYGSLDSEGRTLLSKAIKVMKGSGIDIDWKKVRKSWSVEEVDKIIAKVVDLIECLEANEIEKLKERAGCEGVPSSDWA